jgi:hypothetical protein
MKKRFLFIAGALYIFFHLVALDVPALNHPDHSSLDANIRILLRCDPADSAYSANPAEVSLEYDDHYLFITASLPISGTLNKGHYTAKDVWPGKADYLRFQIITDPESYTSYTFYAFPLGNTYDGIRNKDHDVDTNWDSFYSYSSVINNHAWHIRMQIPFKDLRITGHAPYHWKFLASSYNAASRELYSNEFVTTKMGYDYFRRATDITISENVSRNMSLYLRPYVIAMYDGLENTVTCDEDNVGLDASVKISPTSLLKASINPDFTDTPMDDEEDIYNQKFAPHYNENRYFFIDDDNYFGVDPEIFYSRNIVQPAYALRYTQKEANYTLGALFTQDKKTSISSDDMYGIIAFKPYSARYSCQITGLTRFNDEQHNELLHLQPTARVSRHLYLAADFNASYKEADGEDSKTGYYTFGGIHWFDRDFTLSAQATQMSKDYQADMGYIEEDNYYGWSITASRSKRFRASLFRELECTLGAYDMLDNATSQSRISKYDFCIEADTRLNTDISFDFERIRELYAGTYYLQKSAASDIHWHHYRWMQLHLNLSYSEDLIYYFRNVYTGFNQRFGINGDISRYLAYNCEASHIKYYDTPAHLTPYIDDEYWYGNLDFTINISNRLSLTNGVRYNNYEFADYRSYVGFFSNLRWEYRPGSHLFIGYKRSEDEIGPRYTPTLDQAYIKLTYLY